MQNELTAKHSRCFTVKLNLTQMLILEKYKQYQIKRFNDSVTSRSCVIYNTVHHRY